jgi:hypothetical protein
MKKHEKKDWEKDMENFVQAFLNRPTYKKLTEDILLSIPDDVLEQAVIDNIQSKMRADFRNQYEIVTRLSKGRQAIYTTFYLEAEVCNGGFNQYFYNSTGRFAQEAFQGLVQIGAVKLTDLMNQAISLYQANEEKITQEQDGSLEGFSKSYEDNPLNELDDNFYTLKKEENLSALRINYIRKNPKEFID